MTEAAPEGEGPTAIPQRGGAPLPSPSGAGRGGGRGLSLLQARETRLLQKVLPR